MASSVPDALLDRNIEIDNPASTWKIVINMSDKVAGDIVHYVADSPSFRERINTSGTWGSALSTAEFAAVRSVGFVPAGQAFGAAVFNFARPGQSGRSTCYGLTERLSAGTDPRSRARRQSV